MLGNDKKSNQKGLKIIIVGCGKVGSTLTEELSAEGHDVSVIDQNAGAVQTLSDAYDVMGYAGNGASLKLLQEAGIDTADLIIAVTGSDELNLLCCTVAKRESNCAAIARVRTPEYSEEADYLRERLGLALIVNPDQEAANEITRVLTLPTALEIDTFIHAQAELIKIKIPDNNVMDGKTIATIAREHSFHILICGVERDGIAHIPSGAFVLHSGDQISFIGTRKHIKEFLESVGFDTKSVKDTMIVGGGRSAMYLAKNLMNSGIQVKIIEKDLERCRKLSENFPNAVVIQGDGTDESVLMESGLKEAESFIPLTGIDEENVMLTLHAKHVSKAKVITKINRNSFRDVIDSMDLGSVIYPRYITSEVIVAYVRAMRDSKKYKSNVLTLYHLFNAQAEAVEFRVSQNSKIIGKKLMDLKIKENTLIALIFHRGKVIIPGGSSVIEANDRVVVVTANLGLDHIEDILA